MNPKNTKKISDSWECGREHNPRFWLQWHQLFRSCLYIRDTRYMHRQLDYIGTSAVPVPVRMPVEWVLVTCALIWVLYNTLFSREENFAKSEFEIFSREDIFANILFTRKYLPAKISSRENNFPRKYLLAKISSRENIFLRIFSVPQICRLVGLSYAVEAYYSIT